MQKSGLFLTISTIALIASIALMYVKGFNYGIEFRGGVKLTAKFVQPTTDGTIQEALAKDGLDAIVQKLGVDKDQLFTIKTKQAEASLQETIDKVKASLTSKYGDSAYTIEAEETVGPTVGKELRRKGILAITLTLLGIFVYLAFRFNVVYAPGAVLSLLHDVIFIAGVVVLLNMEFDLSILAVLMTIAGFSVNDTIVIFDRIRENQHRMNTSNVADVVDDCINATMSRTIVTTLTVFMVVVILFFIGGPVIHNFAKAFSIGILIGVYSTIFIACPIFVFMYRYWPKLATKLGFKHARI